MQMFKMRVNPIENPEMIDISPEALFYLKQTIRRDCRFIIKFNNRLISGMRIDGQFQMFLEYFGTNVIKCFEHTYNVDIDQSCYSELFDGDFDSYIMFEDVKIFGEFFKIIVDK